MRWKGRDLGGGVGGPLQFLFLARQLDPGSDISVMLSFLEISS